MKRRRADATPMSVSEKSFAAIDVETAVNQTGAICQVGAVVFDGDGRPVEGQRRELLVRPPGNRYDPDFSKYHGINPADTDDAPAWADAAVAIAEMVKGLPLVAHNAEYELEQFAAAEGTPPNCGPPLSIVRCACPVTLIARRQNILWRKAPVVTEYGGRGGKGRCPMRCSPGNFG